MRAGMLIVTFPTYDEQAAEETVVIGE
jgi:hypothetical protein